MKRYLLILLVVTSASLKAQPESKEPKDELNHNFYFGYRTLFQNFYNQLNTVESFDLNAPLQIAGFRAFAMLPYKINYFEIGYALIIPLRERIQDTLTANISGFTYGLAIGRRIKSKHVDFSYYAGLSFGRTIIYGNRQLLQKNPFIGPKIGISPGLWFGRVGVKFTAEYEYDLTSTRWKKTLFSKGDILPVDRLRQSALTMQIGITYTIIDK